MNKYKSEYEKMVGKVSLDRAKYEDNFRKGIRLSVREVYVLIVVIQRKEGQSWKSAVSAT